MNEFYANLDPDDAVDLEHLSRLMFELRRNLDALLEHWGVEDAEALLRGIQLGELAEHPAYEHYLSARVLMQTRDEVREQLVQLTREINRR